MITTSAEQKMPIDDKQMISMKLPKQYIRGLDILEEQIGNKMKMIGLDDSSMNRTRIIKSLIGVALRSDEEILAIDRHSFSTKDLLAEKYGDLDRIKNLNDICSEERLENLIFNITKDFYADVMNKNDLEISGKISKRDYIDRWVSELSARKETKFCIHEIAIRAETSHLLSVMCILQMMDNYRYSVMHTQLLAFIENKKEDKSFDMSRLTDTLESVCDEVDSFTRE